MCQGTMLSHDNIVFAAREFSKLNLWRDGEERIVTYLPLSHIAGTRHVTILTCHTPETSHS